MARLRKPAKETIKTPPRLMQARFRADCDCGATIAMGDLMFYDKYASVRVRCVPCGRAQSNLSRSGLQIVKETPELQSLMDRVKQLQSVGKTLSNSDELGEVVGKLVEGHAAHNDARKLICSLSMCQETADFVGISVRFDGPCTHCSAIVKAGETALYDRAAKRLHCLNCELSPRLN
ncbi:MAG TPA: hypothetical protein V6C76_04635 [Drouetiella sp.]